ncbi:MAG: CBS domain-containing protein [Burkholderiaceae bacterium]
MSFPISSMMQRQVHAVGMDDSLASIEALLREKRLSWAPVQDPAGRVVGVVSATDLLQARARQPDTDRISAWQLCTYKPVAVEPTTPVGDVARLMVERRIHHVVVIDGDALVGVVSSLDFVDLFESQSGG